MENIRPIQGLTEPLPHGLATTTTIEPFKKITNKSVNTRILDDSTRGKWVRVDHADISTEVNDQNEDTTEHNSTVLFEDPSTSHNLRVERLSILEDRTRGNWTRSEEVRPNT